MAKVKAKSTMKKVMKAKVVKPDTIDPNYVYSPDMLDHQLVNPPQNWLDNEKQMDGDTRAALDQQQARHAALEAQAQAQAQSQAQADAAARAAAHHHHAVVAPAPVTEVAPAAADDDSLLAKLGNLIPLNDALVGIASLAAVGFIAKEQQAGGHVTYVKQPTATAVTTADVLSTDASASDKAVAANVADFVGPVTAHATAVHDLPVVSPTII